MKFTKISKLFLAISLVGFLAYCNQSPQSGNNSDIENRNSAIEEALSKTEFGPIEQVISKEQYEEALEEEFDGTFEYNEFVTITSGDGTRLAGNVFKPVTSNQNLKFPAIIFVNSWSLEEHEYIVQAAKFAKKGYIVLSYSTRGFGLSEGYINVAGPKDMEDLDAALDWLEANTQVDVENIGIAGISYGGGISLLGLAQHDRIKTAASLSGWASLVEALWGGETPRLVWGAVLLASGYVTGRMDPIIAEMYSNLLLYKNVDLTKAWALLRSPISYVDAINSGSKPVYISNNFSDNLFQPNAILDFYKRLTSPKKLDLNQGIHATAEIGGLLGANNYVWNNVHRWFDHWLKGIDNGIMSEKPVSMERKFSNERETFNSWPSAQVNNKTYYLKPRSWIGHGKLLTSPNSTSKTEKIYSGLDTLASTGIPILSPILEAHIDVKVKTLVGAVSTINGVVYQSGSVSATHIRGIPKVNLRITPSKTKAQLHVYLYEVDKWGMGTLITHGPRTLNEATPGKAVNVAVDLVATSYNVKSGNKLAIAVDTFDALYAVPTLAVYNVKFHSSSSQQNTLVLPVKN